MTALAHQPALRTTGFANNSLSVTFPLLWPDNLLFTMARMQKSVQRAIISARTGKHLPRVNCSLPCARVVVRIGAWLCRGGHAREGSRYFLSSRRYSVPGIVTSAAVGRWTRGFPQRWSGKGLMSSQVDEGLVAVSERRWEEMRRDDRNSEGEGRGRRHTSDSPSLHPVTQNVFFHRTLTISFTRSFGPPEDSRRISEGAFQWQQILWKYRKLSRNYDFRSNQNIWDYNYNFHKKTMKVVTHCLVDLLPSKGSVRSGGELQTITDSYFNCTNGSSLWQNVLQIIERFYFC